jgi:hypothetical protein
MEETIMNRYSIFPGEKLAITASERSSKHDFDFLVGGWKIRNRKLKEPLSGRDEWDEFDGKPFEGFTLRLFDPQTRLWTIYWTWEWNWHAYFSRS